MRIVTASCRIMIVSSVVLVAALLALFFGGGLFLLVPIALGVVGPGFVMRKRSAGTVMYASAEGQIELITAAMLRADSALLSELHQSCDRFHWTDQRPQTARWFIVNVTGQRLPSTVQFIRISGNLGVGYCNNYHGTYQPVSLLDEGTKQKLAQVMTDWYGHIR